MVVWKIVVEIGTRIGLWVGLIVGKMMVRGAVRLAVIWIRRKVLQMAVCVLIQLILVQTGSVFGCLGAGEAVRGAGLVTVV